MKIVIVLTAIVAMAQSQRPPYAGSRKHGYQQVLPQYRITAVTESQDSTTNVADRFNEGSNNIDLSAPHDPYNDPQLLAQIATWPEDRQPFWYKNYQAIQQFIGAKKRTQAAAQTTDSILYKISTNRR